MYHIPVLPQEVLDHLAPKPHGVYVDTTFGGGGHTRLILEAEPTCKVIALDWDKKAIELNSPPLIEEFGDRFTILFGSFAQIKQLLKKERITQVDGILADFGTSQHQIKEQPGFSFTIDSPLDMRMSPGHFKTTAADIVNKATEKELADIFYTYGGEHSSRKVAKFIVSARKKKKISTTKQLADIVQQVIPPYSRPIHPATKVFQALRIFVNDELNNIKSLLNQSIDLLAPEGRIVTISFHSLEDRIIKQFFKAHTEQLTILTKKVVIATPEERAQNPSSRSAKLRAAEKKTF